MSEGNWIYARCRHHHGRRGAYRQQSLHCGDKNSTKDRGLDFWHHHPEQRERTRKDEDDTVENRREQRRVGWEDGARCMRAFVKRHAMTRRRGTRLYESDAKRRSEDAEAGRLNE